MELSKGQLVFVQSEEMGSPTSHRLLVLRDHETQDVFEKWYGKFGYVQDQSKGAITSSLPKSKVVTKDNEPHFLDWLVDEGYVRHLNDEEYEQVTYRDYTNSSNTIIDI